MRARWRLLSNYLGLTGTILLVMKSGQLIANQNWEFFYSYEYMEYYKTKSI